MVVRGRLAMAAALAVLLLGIPAYAQLEPVVGVSFNTYAFDWHGSVDPGLAFYSGPGLYGGARYWMNENVALGFQVEYLTGRGERTDTSVDLDADGEPDRLSLALGTKTYGYLATVIYRLDTGGPLSFHPFVGAGIYEGEVYEETSAIASSTGKMTGIARLHADAVFGAQLGVQAALDLQPGLTLHGVVGYRLVPELYESGPLDLVEYNISGFSAGVALTYRF